MGKTSKVLWGLVLIAIGIVIGANAMGITNINIFFKGWWTLFIIIPCFIGLFNPNESNKTGNIIGLIIGTVLLLATRGLIGFEIIVKMIVPFIFVAIGISLIFNETLKGKISEKVKEANKDGLENIIATFAGQKVKKDDEEFTGANLEAIFGGIVLDLRNANIEKEAIIKSTSIFGGVEIIMPSNVKVKVKSTPIFGGVSNKYVENKESEKVIYIDAFCMFGGVDIK